MKYIVVLCDGAADTPNPELGGKTPLQVAYKPHIDNLARVSMCGTVKTVPDSMKPGSDVANLSVMGYDPEKYYTGRSPLEALSIGIDMAEDDLAVRCNLVTLSMCEEYEKKTMVDYSAGEISTEEARELIAAVQEALGDDIFKFYSGVSYRHCLIAKHTAADTQYTPPHDITGKVITDYLPKGLMGEQMLDLMKKSWRVLVNHPVNMKRIAEGKNPANSIWLWGEGTRPMLPEYEQMYGKKAAVISAVDLLKGIGIAGGMKVIEVEGATGTIDTNFAGKAEACVQAIRDGYDYVYLHMEATDECGHQGDVTGKVRSLELIDGVVVGYILEQLRGEDITILVTPDHPTPLALRTHTRDAVPFIIYNSTKVYEGVESYTEENCEGTELKLESGEQLAKLLFDNDNIQEESIEDIATELADSEDKEQKNLPEAVLPQEHSEEGAEFGEVTLDIADESQEDICDSDISQSKDIEVICDPNGECVPVLTQSENGEDGAEENTQSVQKDKAKDKEKKKKEKKESTLDEKAKKKKTAIIISCVAAAIVVVLLVSILTPILVINHPKFFVGKAEDFKKPIKDYKEYIELKNDVTVEEDLTIGLNLNLDEHILTVDGTLTINTKGKELNIGSLKKKNYEGGGKIIAKNIVIKDSSNNVNIQSDIKVEDSLTISNVSNAELNGETMVKDLVIKSDVPATQSLDIDTTPRQNETTIENLIMQEEGSVNIINNKVTFNSEVKAAVSASKGSNVVFVGNVGNITLDNSTNVEVAGNVYADFNTKELGVITGGNEVYMRVGSNAKLIKGAREVWLDKASDIQTEDSVERYIYTLARPLYVKAEVRDGKIWLNVPTSKNAKRIEYTINGGDKVVLPVSDNGEYDITSAVVTAGVYTIQVRFLPEEGEEKYIQPSPITTLKYTYQIKLNGVDKDSIQVTRNAEQDYILTFKAVGDSANQYKIMIDSYELIVDGTPNEAGNIVCNLSEKAESALTMGAHNVSVIAQNTEDINILDSEAVGMTTPLVVSGSVGNFTASYEQKDNSVEVEWTPADNAARYEITIMDGIEVKYKGVVSGKSTTIIVPNIATQSNISVTVKAIGKDGYEDSNEVIAIQKVVD